MRPVRSTGEQGNRDRQSIRDQHGIRLLWSDRMDICVCGAQVPFMYGGAEQLLENLVGALAAAGHRADLVRLPAAWERGAGVRRGAWRGGCCRSTPTCVIATNFPSYFVRHPRKVVWLFHQHRVAYDLAGSELSDFDLDDGASRSSGSWSSGTPVRSTRRRCATRCPRVVSDRLARYNGLASTPLHHPPPLLRSTPPGTVRRIALHRSAARAQQATRAV